MQLKVFTSDNSYGTNPTAVLFAHVWKRVLIRYMHEYLYTATKAGSVFYAEFDEDDVSLYWQGYNEHLADYVAQTCQTMVGMRKAPASALEPLFNEAKAWLLLDFAGSAQVKSYRQALDLLP